MLTFLILVSLLLHLVTFVIIRLQSGKMAAVVDREEKIQKQAVEMEELLSTYLFEIRDENDRFINQLQNKGQYDDSTEDYEKKEPGEKIIPEPVGNEETKSGESETSKRSEDHNVQEKPVYSPPIELVDEDTFEKSATLEAFSLYKQGDSVESIARKLNCGKTEVELMLKFYRKQ